MVHTPTSLKEAMKIPDRGRRVEQIEEVTTLELQKSKPKADVVKNAKQDHVPVHFVSLTDLCHLKHAELARHFQKYKEEWY